MQVEATGRDWAWTGGHTPQHFLCSACAPRTRTIVPTGEQGDWAWQSPGQLKVKGEEAAEPALEQAAHPRTPTSLPPCGSTPGTASNAEVHGRAAETRG